MPIYFANEASENQKVPEPLRRQGLNFIRTAPSGFRIFAAPEIIHNYYSVFISQLYLVIYAIWANRLVPSGNDDYYIGSKPPHLTYLPFTIPPIAVSFTSTTAIIEVGLTDRGFYKQNANDESMYCKDTDISLDDIAYLVQQPTAILTTRVPWQYINIQAALGMITIIKYLTLLTIAFTYPSISNTSEYDAYTEPGTKRKRGADSEATSVEDGDLEFKGQGYLSGAQVWLSTNAAVPRRLNFKVSKSQMARPAVTDLRTYTTNNAVKQFEEGFWFPFHDDVTRPDDAGPLPLLTELCYQNFGRNDEERAKMVNILKGAWGLLKRTTAGNEIAHYSNCLKLAVQGQAAMRPVFSGDHYEGVVIIGYKLKVVIGHETRYALNQVSLVSELQYFFSHDDAVRKIHTILTGMELDENTDTTPYNSMAAIRGKVLETDLTTQKKNDLIAMARRLRFKTTKWQSNYQFVVQAANTIAGLQQIDGSNPIAPEMLTSSDIVEVVLSCFGRACPSPVIPDGRMINLTSPMPQPVNRVIESRGNKPSRTTITNDLELTIQFRLVDMEVALSDWKWLIKNKKYRVAPLQTARANGYKIIKGAERGVVFDALRTLVNASETASGGPRDRDRGSRTEGGSIQANERLTGIFDMDNGNELDRDEVTILFGSTQLDDRDFEFHCLSHDFVEKMSRLEIGGKQENSSDRLLELRGGRLMNAWRQIS